MHFAMHTSRGESCNLWRTPPPALPCSPTSVDGSHLHLRNCFNQNHQASFLFSSLLLTHFIELLSQCYYSDFKICSLSASLVCYLSSPKHHQSLCDIAWYLRKLAFLHPFLLHAIYFANTRVILLLKSEQFGGA